MKDYKENYGMYKDLKTILPKVIENIEANYKNDFDNEKQYVTTDFKGINFKKGNLIILASRPCLGMISLALNLLLNIVTKKQKAAGYITCGNQDETDITKKLLSIKSEIPMNKIRSANLNVNDVKKLSEISDGFWNQPIFINDSPNIFFEEFELAASLMVEQQNVEIIFVDSYEYLREVVDADKEELPFVQRTLLEEYKQAAKDLNIPIVMLMNLPRSDNDEPSISDFKANMIIPRTADVVYFLHRERIKDDRKRCEATLSTGKDVNGRNTYSNLYFYPETGLFKDCTEE